MNNYQCLDRTFIRERQRLAREEEERKRRLHHEHMMSYVKLSVVALGSFIMVLVLPVAFVLAMIFAPIVAVVSVGVISLGSGYILGKRHGRQVRETMRENELEQKLEGLSSRLNYQHSSITPVKSGLMADTSNVVSIFKGAGGRRTGEQSGNVGRSIEGLRDFNHLGY